jgi:hypothetical protein
MADASEKLIAAAEKIKRERPLKHLKLISLEEAQSLGMFTGPIIIVSPHPPTDSNCKKS